MRHFGTIVSFDLRAGAAAGDRFADALKLFAIAASMGSPESLIIPPGLMGPHDLPPELAALNGIDPGTVRLSIGLEDPGDLIADIETGPGSIDLSLYCTTDRLRMVAARLRPMTRILLRTPRSDGYWMPGEFERHAGTWMLWPERLDNWRSGAVPAQQAFAAVAAAIARFEPVSVGASAAHYGFARAHLDPRVRVIEISSNDAWMRDVGPTFVVNAAGRRRAVDWQFNAWGGLDGGLYFPWDQDELVAQKVAAVEGVDRYRAPLIMEGGAIHADGQGTLLVTEPVPAESEPQSAVVEAADRRPAQGVHRRKPGHLARRRRDQRRNRWSCRQPGLLRKAR